MKTDLNRDIPMHEHTASVFTRCLACHMWGTNLPSRFVDAAECGNCGSMQTVKYYPACCIIADREHLPLRKETGACAMCGALAEEQVVPPKTDPKPDHYCPKCNVALEYSFDCEGKWIGRCTNSKHARPTRSGA